MEKKLLTNKINCILLIILFLGSCRKTVEIDIPKNQIITDNVFKNSALLNSAVLNIYKSLDIGSFITYNALYTGELVNSRATSLTPPYDYSVIPSDDNLVYNTWKTLYSSIYQCNALLEGLPGSENIPDSVLKRTKGETKFIRALSYFYLINIWGDVPKLTTTEVLQTAVAARIPATEIYSLIINDLDTAIVLLNDSYPPEEKVRATKWAATGLLARTYLYLRDWNKAETLATAIITSNLFSPLPTLPNSFLKNNKESIFQIWMQNGFTSVGSSYVPSSTTTAPVFSASPNLLSSFEVNDNRKSSWLNPITVAMQPYYYPYKYKARTTTTGTAAEYLTLLRLGEIYLIRAEARIQQNNLTAGIADLNVIRTRAGLPNLSASLSQNQALNALEQERKIELFAENGHRFFDLKRWGKIDLIIGGIKPTWKTGGSLYPIPKSEILVNPSLTQNPGYN
jgi:starch-binding outer membrane protein, SusD/RagB family